MWYMRNVETAAQEGMNCILVGTLDGFDANVQRYRRLWEVHHGPEFKTSHGDEPKIGLVTHLLLADTNEAAIEAAIPAWENYLWNLTTPRRLEAERRGLTQFISGPTGGIDRPDGLPAREAASEFRSGKVEARNKQQKKVESHLGMKQEGSASFRVIAGTPGTICDYLDTYMVTGANYFVCAFHFGDMKSWVAEQSIDLFIREVMPRYA